MQKYIVLSMQIFYTLFKKRLGSVRCLKYFERCLTNNNIVNYHNIFK